MINSQLQRASEFAGITIAALCSVHCLLLPFLILALPFLSTLPIASESVHEVLAIITLPISGYALYLGYLRHKTPLITFTGCVGIFFILAAVLTHDIFHSDAVEKGFTLLGSMLVIFAHLKNYRLCSTQSKAIAST